MLDLETKDWTPMIEVVLLLLGAFCSLLFLEEVLYVLTLIFDQLTTLYKLNHQVEVVRSNQVKHLFLDLLVLLVRQDDSQEVGIGINGVEH